MLSSVVVRVSFHALGLRVLPACGCAQSRSFVEMRAAGRSRISGNGKMLASLPEGELLRNEHVVLFFPFSLSRVRLILNFAGTLSFRFSNILKDERLGYDVV